ncbi:ferritin family protein [Halanaerobacter jeridensis]|uniref:Rubrerythrin n=1 Tax=Halanaerobacter jeridensis TaxID=706427 RepID=A0A938XUW0_9FIRM|nr:ferritin-like domain-containing protein [Halanaerobacter jeridensis]MBM7555675.1 rubrerythrin [Halanaerobacter jeridensis]
MNNQERMNIRSRMLELEKRRNRSHDLEGGEIDFLLERIYLAIEAELRDAAYYLALADIAPNQFAAEMISDFAQDEREHAYQLQQAYEHLTGKTFRSEYEYEFELNPADYEEYLEKRVLDETKAYQEYKSYYLMTHNPYLRDIFFNAMVDESQHAQRELYLLQTMGMPMM